jgi:hypothetical protein
MRPENRKTIICPVRLTGIRMRMTMQTIILIHMQGIMCMLIIIRILMIPQK